ncbi:MAG: sigma-70 family RNA polymerase sigma factor [Bacteroidia bacterium]|nr:sigma-70 family RNA polymerase sigma factor [Bacteroidia bacterium]
MELTQLADDKLIQLYVNGNEKCLEVLLNRYQEKIFTYIRMMVKDRARAEDVFQEAFFKVITSLKSGKYSDEGHFCAWVKCICRNIVIDEVRVEEKMPTISHVRSRKDDEDKDIFSVLKLYEEETPTDRMDRQEYRQNLRREMRFLIRQLPEQQREVVMMRYFFNMSFNEISNLLEINLNTALGRMHYAANNMRKLAGKYGKLKMEV